MTENLIKEYRSKYEITDERIEEIKSRYPDLLNQYNSFKRLGKPGVTRNPFLSEICDSNGRGRVLVPGCGAGEDVFLLRMLGFDAYGVDINERYIQAGIELHGEGAEKYLLEGNVTRLSFDDGYFDIVVHNSLIHSMIQEGNVLAGFREMERVLSSHGKMMGRHLGTSLEGIIVEHIPPKEGKGLLFLPSKDWLKYYLSKIGFEISDIEVEREDSIFRISYLCQK